MRTCAFCCLITLLAPACTDDKGGYDDTGTDATDTNTSDGTGQTSNIVITLFSGDFWISVGDEGMTVSPNTGYTVENGPVFGYDYTFDNVTAETTITSYSYFMEMCVAAGANYAPVAADYGYGWDDTSVFQENMVDCWTWFEEGYCNQYPDACHG